jgi:hypothetical protein
MAMWRPQVGGRVWVKQSAPGVASHLGNGSYEFDRRAREGRPVVIKALRDCLTIDHERCSYCKRPYEVMFEDTHSWWRFCEWHWSGYAGPGDTEIFPSEDRLEDIIVE